MQHAAFLPLNAMDPATMRAVFNHMALERGQKPAPRKADIVALAKGIALFRATPVKAAPCAKAPAARAQRERPAIVRDVALEELARVCWYTMDKSTPKNLLAASIFEAGSYDGEWYSVGATFSEIAQTVRKRCPGSKITPPVLRRFAHHVRHVADLAMLKRPVPPELEPFRDVLLPEHRFKSKKGLFSYDQPETDSNGRADDRTERRAKRAGRASAKPRGKSRTPNGRARPRAGKGVSARAR
jgi:hypothetical protein